MRLQNARVEVITDDGDRILLEDVLLEEVTREKRFDTTAWTLTMLQTPESTVTVFDSEASNG